MRRLARSTGLAALVTAAALVPAPPIANAQPSHQPSHQAPSADKAGWHAAGRLSGLGYDYPMVATSTSNIVFAVAPGSIRFESPDPESALMRRLPNGNVTRLSQRIGGVIGVDVAHGGRATVIGQRDDAIVVVTWAPGAAKPSTKVLHPRGLTIDDLFSVEMLTSPRGDVALAIPGQDDSVVIVRRPATGAWERPIVVTKARYKGLLDDLDMGSSGQLTAAFRRNHVVRLRTLPLGKRAFGGADTVIEWPGIPDDNPLVIEEFATVERGPSGDLLATLTYGKFIDAKAATPATKRGDVAYWTKMVILPKQGKEWRHFYDRGSDGFGDAFAMAADGSITRSVGIKTERWTPKSREFHGKGTSFLKASSARGDVLVGSGIYRGSVWLWPAGRQPGRAVDLPKGDTRASAVTDEGRAVIVVAETKTRKGYYVYFRDLQG